jgi:hypothetical protein
LRLRVSLALNSSWKLKKIMQLYGSIHDAAIGQFIFEQRT